MDVVSCSSGGPSPVNASSAGLPLNSATPVTNQTTPVSASTTLSTTAPSSNNGIITPKVESSPPEHYERQTVLMWGATGAPQATNRSPNTTPTSNGMYSEAHHLKISNQMAMSPVIEDSHHHHGHHNSHLKWNGSSKDIAYPSIHQPHHESAGLEHPASTMYAQVSQAAGLGHHGAPHIIGNDHGVLHQSPQGHAGAPATPQGGAGVGAQAQTVVGSSCEVWSPASYSQYQYFTYHHAPQHASTQ